MALIEVTKKTKYARCACGFDAKLSRFRLVTISDVPQADGSIKQVRHFDGVYRCPMCGTANPKQRIEELTEWDEE